MAGGNAWHVDPTRPARVIVVAAAGNEGAVPGVPADCPGVIAVTALRHHGEKVGFSSFGPTVTLSAPGGNCGTAAASGGELCQYPLVSTDNSALTTPDAAGFTYGGKLGTRFSAPLVAGVVALMFSVNPVFTADEITQRMIASARSFPDAGVGLCTVDNGGQGPCFGTTSMRGASMLDAFAAVKTALMQSPSPAPVAPVGQAAGPTLAPAVSIADGSGGGGAFSGVRMLIVLAAMAVQRRST